MSVQDVFDDEDSSVDTDVPEATSRETENRKRHREVLLIEDDVADYQIIERYLKVAEDVTYHVECVTRLADGLARLSQGGVHLVLLNLDLPDSDGLESFNRVHADFPKVPVIVLAGLANQSVAIQATSAGAQDYLVKGEFDSNLLLRSIRYARARHKAQSEAARTLQFVRASEASLTNVLAANVDGVLVIDQQGVVQYSNVAAQRLIGRSAAELREEPLGLPLTASEATEIQIRHSDGSSVPVELRVVPLEWERKPASLAVLRDLGRQEKAEEVRARLAAIVQATSDAVLTLDLDGFVRTWNPGAERLYGYSADEMVGQHISILSPPDLQDGHVLFETVQRGGEVSGHETVRVRKDGRKVAVSISAFPIRTEGEIVKYASIARDITEQKRTEEMLRQTAADLYRQTAMLESILNSIGEGVVVADEEGKFVVFNPSAKRMVGLGATDTKPEEWSATYGLFCTDQVTPLPTQELPLARAMRGEEVHGAEVFLRNATVPNGIVVSVSARPVKDAAGNHKGGVVVFRDITLRKQAEEDHIKRFEAESEIALARKVQQSLFPLQPPLLDGFDIAGAVFPAAQASGDYFDYLSMPDGAVGIVVADVSGHGLGPAMLMVQTQAHLRALVETHRDVREILTHASRLFRGDDPTRFVTLLLACIDPRARSFVYASAGHRGYLMKASEEIQILNSTTLPLGLHEEKDFFSVPARMLTAGDVIVLTTDGVEEAASPDDTLFGSDRVLDVVRANRDKTARGIVDALYAAVRDFAGGIPQTDDITVVVVKVLDEPVNHR